jgi:hypothetical protein
MPSQVSFLKGDRPSKRFDGIAAPGAVHDVPCALHRQERERQKEKTELVSLDRRDWAAIVPMFDAKVELMPRSGH